MTSFFLTTIIIVSVIVIYLFVMPTSYVQTKTNATSINTYQARRSSTVFGVVSYDSHDYKPSNHETLDLRVADKVVFGADVTPELWREPLAGSRFKARWKPAKQF
jgi:hypothetical protein